MAITCYRLYDHDLPEFPFCIEIYEQNVYVAEYKRRHGMSEDEHDEWMSRSLILICEVLKVSEKNIISRKGVKWRRMFHDHFTRCPVNSSM